MLEATKEILINELKKTNSQSGFSWNIYVEGKPLASFACTDYVLDHLVGTRAIFIGVPTEFKDIPLIFIYRASASLSYRRLQRVINFIETQNNFKELTEITKITDRAYVFEIPKEWIEDTYRISGYLKLIRCWNYIKKITDSVQNFIISAGRSENKLDDWLKISFLGLLPNINKDCSTKTGLSKKYTGWANHGVGGIVMTRHFTFAHPKKGNPWDQGITDEQYERRENMIPIYETIDNPDWSQFNALPIL